jgi:hypothetical protein
VNNPPLAGSVLSWTQFGARRQGGLIFWAVAGTFVLYLLTTPMVARSVGQAALAPVLTGTAVYPTWFVPVVLLFALSGVAIALFVPGAPWVLAVAGGRLRAASLYHRAFAFNLIQATVFVSAWKAFAGAVPSRPAFIAWQALVAFVGLLVLRRSRYKNGIRLDLTLRPLLVGGVVLLILLPLFLWGKTVAENGSGDGTEAFEFARSLATHHLPYWDLENGHYGFYPQFMLFAFPIQLSSMAIGETEAASRLPVFFYLFGTYLVLVEFVRRRRRRLLWTEAGLLVGAAVFFLVYHAYHSTYELVSDLAEPTGVDTFFMFLAASAVYSLVTRQQFWWGVFSLFGSMALAAGLPFALLFLLGRVVATTPRARWVSMRSYAFSALAFAVPWLTYQFLVSLYSILHPLGIPKWTLGNVLNQYPLRATSADTWELLVNLAIVVAIVPLVGLGFIASRDRMLRILGVPFIGYFVLLILFARMNPHYLIPISLFPAAIFLRTLAGPAVSPRTRSIGQVAYGAALVTLAIVTLPRDRTPHMAYREFGSHTLMLYDSYPDVLKAAANLVRKMPQIYVHLPKGKPAFPNQNALFEFSSQTAGADEYYVVGSLDDLAGRRATGERFTPWGLTDNVWVRYSDEAPVGGHVYHQILAASHLAPGELEGFSRRNLPDGWVLFYHPEKSIFASIAPVDHRKSGNE